MEEIMNHETTRSGLRSRWAAIGAAVAVSLGAGGIGLVGATSPADAVAYVPVEPCRLADTRAGEFNVGPRNTPISTDETLGVQATGDNGECTGIPTSATGLQLNVTALGATDPTFLTIWGSGDRPNASHLNPSPGQPPTPNAVTTGLTAGGAINVYNLNGTVEVLLDIVGYYTDHNHDDRYYTETEVDTALADKANSADVYTTAEVDAAVATKDNVEAAIDGDDGSTAVTTTDVVVASVTVDTPSRGFVVVNSGGFAWSGTGIMRCSITTGTTTDFTQSVNADVGPGRQSMGTTRGFAVNSVFLAATEVTYNLVCDMSSGSASYADPALTAIFVPDPDAGGFIIALDEPGSGDPAADG